MTAAGIAGGGERGGKWGDGGVVAHRVCVVVMVCVVCACSVNYSLTAGGRRCRGAV